MLPFLKPVHVRQAFPDDEKAAEITTFTDAVGFAIDKMNINTDERNVIMAHQYCTGAIRSESEDISVGGLDNVDASVFEPFDYTALGHLHGPQVTGGARIRYCGSPLKYSFSEANQNKSLTIIEFGDKKDGVCKVHMRTPELVPMRDMRVLKGKFIELTDKNYYKHINADDYMRIILIHMTTYAVAKEKRHSKKIIKLFILIVKQFRHQLKNYIRILSKIIQILI